ncbi:MAG: aldehyde dehydrogenase family protein [Thermoleophilia bacterium]|nr:aldehyde dehydrogenase family protein [Thermoleophilia bacterium]
MTTPLRVQHLIGGEWTGEPAGERRNPARAGEVVAELPAGGPAEAEAALAAAQAAFPGWRRTPAPARGAILLRAAELLASRREAAARDLCAEEGKTVTEATGEVQRAIDILRFFGGEGWRIAGENLPSSVPSTHLYTVKEPLGVVCLITPWNFPIAIPAWKLAPALVAGNTVVLKPATLVPVSVQNLALALIEAGLPPGVLNIVHGRGSVVGDALVNDRRVAAISFTGSVQTGLGIHAAGSARLARVQLEMGGKNALVVLDDADPAFAATVAAQGGFGLTGQACTATSRAIVTSGIHDRFVEALALEAEAWKPGDGQAEGTRMGPVVDRSQLDTDLSYIEAGKEEGARLVAGGECEDLFLCPAVFAGVQPAMRIAREEIFGPVIGVLEVDNLDEAIELANDSEFGLSGGIVTNDLRAALRFADEAEVGIVKVNRPTTGLDLNAPFGGVKNSSSGTFREQGSVAVDFYTRLKTVYLGT